MTNLPKSFGSLSVPATAAENQPESTQRPIERFTTAEHTTGTEFGQTVSYAYRDALLAFLMRQFVDQGDTLPLRRHLDQEGAWEASLWEDWEVLDRAAQLVTAGTMTIHRAGEVNMHEGQWHATPTESEEETTQGGLETDNRLHTNLDSEEEPPSAHAPEMQTVGTPEHDPELQTQEGPLLKEDLGIQTDPELDMQETQEP